MQLCMQLYLGEYNYMYIKKVEKKLYNVTTSRKQASKLFESAY